MTSTDSLSSFSSFSEALPSLLSSLHPYLSAIARSYRISPSDIPDLIQDLALIALTSPLPYTSIRNPESWLCAVFHNLCIMHVRRRTRTRARFCPLDPLAEHYIAIPTSDPYSSPETLAINSATASRLLSQLSNPNHYFALVLYSQGWTYPEIEKEFGVKAKTVRKMKQRGISEIRDRYTE